MLKSLAAAAAALVLFAPATQADEVWDSDSGELVYQADEFGAAIISFTHPDGTPAELVIPDLAGNVDERYTHEAYWIGESDMQCSAALARPGQFASLTWGRALVAFDNPSFPTSFTLTLGDCFWEVGYSMRAIAR